MEWTQVKLNIHRHRRHYLAHRTLIGKTVYFFKFSEIFIMIVQHGEQNIFKVIEEMETMC